MKAKVTIRKNQKFVIGECLVEGEWKIGNIRRAFQAAFRRCEWIPEEFEDEVLELISDIKRGEVGDNFSDDAYDNKFRRLYSTDGVEACFDLWKEADNKICGWIYVHWYMPGNSISYKDMPISEW